MAGLPVSVPGAGGRYTLTVTTGATCAWTVQVDAAWASVTTSSGQGSGTTTLVVEENVAIADTRSATVTIGGQVLRFSQANACTYTIDRTSANVPNEETSVEIRLTTLERCPWTSRTSESWLSVEPPSGTGSIMLRVAAAANFGGTRQATATIANQRVLITQQGR